MDIALIRKALLVLSMPLSEHMRAAGKPQGKWAALCSGTSQPYKTVSWLTPVRVDSVIVMSQQKMYHVSITDDRWRPN